MSRRFWSDLTTRLEPYTPGEQPQGDNLLKLNTNESPYPPSERVLEALGALTGDELLRYPDPEATALRQAAADFHGIAVNCVFAGNGSDEVLSHVFQGLLKHSRELLFPDISYSFYPVWCQLHGVPYRKVPLREDFSIHAEDYDSAAAAVIVPNPNAPTGLLAPLTVIRQFLESAPDRLLVVDEAYIDFGGESAVPLLSEYDNLLVVQTLSKSRALAGLRIGMAFGSPALIEGLERIKDSFNSYPLGVAAQRAGTEAYRDSDWFRQSCNAVMANRQSLTDALVALGFEVLPSAANFVFVKHSAVSGRFIFDALREEGVIIRRWDKPRIEDYLRITIGTEEQCQRLVETLGQVLTDL
ncbi:histidinol-phosphate transaminase [Congregibacter litoralis]|uniref:Histidinol-phosphate aminotransferase n=1 Tax=Congregibacter litoralis KT71 TaxID=314285 RepID=A4A3L3_9GAMM|nr:histidinol-phosphate transaminase [Congregibacter litoralis]EAQ99286.1 histidinol-phosphate aminotransferase [Congregibacter litoralis KT71]